ncbi:MAG: hypothetical protein R2753_07680 [Chitinophagales bacterium]
MLIYINRNFTVRQFRFSKFLITSTFIFISLFMLLQFINLSNEAIIVIGVFTSFIASMLYELVFAKENILFSEELIGEMLSKIKDNDQYIVQKYSQAIKSRLKKGSILLTNEKTEKLDEIRLIFNVYQSCLPISRGNFPNKKETYELFNKIQNKNDNIFEIFNLDFVSLYYIFQINLKYFNFNFETNKSV